MASVRCTRPLALRVDHCHFVPQTAMSSIVNLLRSVVCSCWLCPFFSSPPAGFEGVTSGPRRSMRRPAAAADEYAGEELEELQHQRRHEPDAVYEKDLSSDDDDEDEDGSTDDEEEGEGDTQDGRAEGESHAAARTAHAAEDTQPGQSSKSSKHKAHSAHKAANSNVRPTPLPQLLAAPLPVASPIRHSSSSSSLASPFSSLAAFLSSPSPAKPPAAVSSPASSTSAPAVPAPAASSLKLAPPPSDSATHYWLSRAADDRRRREAQSDRHSGEFVYTEKELDIDAFYEKEVIGSRRTAASIAAADGQHDSEAGGEAGDAKDEAGRRERRKRGLLDEIDVEPDLNAIMDELDGI